MDRQNHTAGRRAGFRRSILTGLILALALPATGALAQPADEVGVGPKARPAAHLRGPYLGVAPGTNEDVPRLRRRRKSGLRVATWVGFQWIGEGGRVFVQANTPPQYTLVPGNPDEIIIDLPETRLRTRNDMRTLDTTMFPTAVASVHAQQLSGDTTRVTIKLREVVGYDLRQEGNFLLLDFRPPVQLLGETQGG